MPFQNLHCPAGAMPRNISPDPRPDSASSDPTIQYWSTKTAPPEILALLPNLSEPAWLALIPLSLCDPALIDHLRCLGQAPETVITICLSNGSHLLAWLERDPTCPPSARGFHKH